VTDFAVPANIIRKLNPVELPIILNALDADAGESFRLAGFNSFGKVWLRKAQTQFVGSAAYEKLGGLPVHDDQPLRTTLPFTENSNKYP
jgi:hypothetical protein